MFLNNSIVKLLNITYPIIQGGMVYCSDYKLASAVSNAGGLGTIGAGAMTPEELEINIKKCKDITNKPFAVNIPLISEYSNTHVRICVDLKVPVVITSAGNPVTYTEYLKKNNIKVLHVVSNTKFAQKAESAGVDAIIAEGFEAGGHNGKEETTTFVLIPLISKSVNIPVIAAGGICTGKHILAALALGASGVQIGTLFIASEESSAHVNFKNKIINSKEGDTMLCLKKIIPTRLIKNEFYNQLLKMEEENNYEQIKNIIRGRPKMGMLEGNIEDGMLEAGQNVCLIDEILPVSKIIENLINEFKQEYYKLQEKFNL
ncbi:MAG: DUF561 domain-containing protein [Bacteroidales bacterium]|nr:DUF561 domain-containing protein [Bacteroidales bacterium]